MNLLKQLFHGKAKYLKIFLITLFYYFCLLLLGTPGSAMMPTLPLELLIILPMDTA